MWRSDLRGQDRSAEQGVLTASVGCLRPFLGLFLGVLFMGAVVRAKQLLLWIAHYTELYRRHFFVAPTIERKGIKTRKENTEAWM